MDGVISVNKIEEKKVLIKIIGILESLSYNAITIPEGEKYIFSPKFSKRLIDMNCNKNIIDIVEECCELEDIESLIPEKLDQNINSLKLKSIEVLKSYDKFDSRDWN
ncbi:MAG: DUF3969 family protein [Clostridia bacterium]|nr:DUF3969 family protein [Clostridia bacterium]